MQCPRCQHANPSHAKFCMECGTPLGRLSETGSPRASYEDQERALGEALEQQTATAEILRVISSSPTDIQPVLDTVVRSAARFCGAYDVAIFRLDGDHLRCDAHYGPVDQPDGLLLSLGRETVGGRTVLERRPIHVADLHTETAEYPEAAANARRLGFRTILSVPLVREGVAIGAIQLRRAEVSPFTDKQITLLQTFADQAVIAIENVRLFKELEARNHDLTEALDQQTATSEILRVISQSPTDVQPVFDTIMQSAVRLCGARIGVLYRFDGELLHLAAHRNLGPDVLATLLRLYPMRPNRETASGRAILGRAVAELPDALADPEYRYEIAIAGDWRSMLAVPMLREGDPIGTIVINRSEPGAFPESQIALLQTFADQAVIAIENVRLFKELEASNAELTESLAQQTATSEILRTIAHAQTDTQPVFDTIVRSAARLCHGANAALFLTHGGMLYEPANYGSSPEARAATRARYPRPVGMDTPPGIAILTRSVVHVPDTEDPSATEHVRQGARLLGFRGLVTVPMLREGEPVGAIIVTHRDPGLFSDAEVALLKTFADQAVIAVENARLFTELQEKNQALTQAHAQVTEALEQQTATSEILRVISSSPTDVQPVFDAIAHSAARLCEAFDVVVLRVQENVLHLVAHHGPLPVVSDVPLHRRTLGGRTMIERQVIHILDLQAEVDEFPEGSAIARVGGHRTTLSVPLLREGVAIGNIQARRQEVRPFSDTQISLLTTFADQAVIAIENVRLFKELEARNHDLTEALEQQTATGEILRVISSSPTDLGPVMDAVAENAARLCDASDAQILRADGETITLVASYGSLPTISREPRPISRRLVGGRATIDRVTLHIPDVTLVQDEFPDSSTVPLGVRTALAIPLLREGTAIGVIMIRRMEVRPFSDKQVALLQTFANQAVIAIENVRLFKELEARTAELTRSVGELTALGEVSQALSSTLDLETVLTTIVSRAVQLSGLDGGVVFEYDEGTEEFVQRAAAETGGVLAQARRGVRYRKGEGALGRTAITLEPVQVPDITVPGAYDSRVRENLIESGIRAILAVPMVHQGRLIGCLGVTRNHPGDFTAETIELLRTFATQSALAIQNARLFHEIADKSRQLEAASQHKSEFLANMSHELRTPLNAIIGFSEVLAQGMFGEINEKQTEYLHDILESGRHLLSLINDILDLSKIEAGRMELELTEFDLPQAIQNALTLVRERALRRGIALHHVIDDRVADIRADERKVKQVLLNLLSNAIKFTPEGGRIDVRAVLADGLIEVSVADSGVGIAPEDQEAVFEEFRQVGTADKKAEGTGLGLALSRKFIELHGGTIRVQSEVGRGATFTFSLPITSAAGMDHRVARD